MAVRPLADEHVARDHLDPPAAIGQPLGDAHADLIADRVEHHGLAGRADSRRPSPAAA